MCPDTVVLVPRWGGDADDDWYPWLASLLSARHDMRVVDLRPHPDRPQVPATVSAIAETVRVLDPGRTLLVGHSVGCQALLRYLAQRTRRRDDVAFAGLACVAGWWTVDEPWSDISAWLDSFWAAKPGLLRRVHEVVADVSVLLSDDDPFTADWRATQELWEHRLDATVTVVPGGRHFNGAAEPSVLDLLARHHDVVVTQRMD